MDVSEASLKQLLKIKGIFPEASDITYLAKTWERLDSSVEYVRPSFCCDLLYFLSSTYLRGKGLKLGGKKWEQKTMMLAALSFLIVERVVDDEARQV
ncbi:MAG: hypothetical protein ABIH46_07170 [Chloroflexota bacterium]